MARTWLSIAVELIGGRGEELWPRPGRIFAVGPAHTFQDFADAINTAFARWARAPLNEFTLADGTRITGFDPYEELAETPRGPIILPLDITKKKFFAPSDSAINSSLFSISVIIGSTSAPCIPSKLTLWTCLVSAQPDRCPIGLVEIYRINMVEDQWTTTVKPLYRPNRPNGIPCLQTNGHPITHCRSWTSPKLTSPSRPAMPRSS